MNTSNIRWLYFRLKAMSAGEILHRFREQAKRRFDSRRKFRFNDSPMALPVIPGLRDRVKACSDIAREQFCAAANDVRNGRYHFLGQDWPAMGGTPDWHLDPISGQRWPDHPFCYSVPFRHNVDYGDVKFVWELNRLQHLQMVAAAAACEGDPELARLCISQIRSWIGANPPFKGLNWASGIELALRVVSFVIVFSLIPQSTISEDDHRAISASLRAHSYWLKRYPSRFSSANNHLIAEAGGLFLLGLLLPELPEAKNIQQYGRRVLNTEALLQFFPDGVPAEQSPTYGAFSAEWLLYIQAVASTVGDRGLKLPALQRLSEFGVFLSWITDKNGNFPRIGDDDEGRVIATLESSSEYVRSVVRAIEGRSTLNSLRDLVLATAADATNLSDANRDGVRTFEQGGYTVVREIVEGKECLLVFDHGPLGHLGIAAHGHADALAVWLHIDGEPVFVDAGTYLYHSGGLWRQYFRGTAAHSTMRLSGSDQSIQSGAFNWSSKAQAKIVSLRDNLDGFFIEAEHNGYLRRFNAIHRRSIERTSPGSYLISDVIRSDRPQSAIEIGFLVRSDLKITETDGGWTISNIGNASVRIECLTKAKRSFQRALEQPEFFGWMSKAFRSKDPASRLVILPQGNLQPTMTRIVLETREPDRFG